MVDYTSAVSSTGVLAVLSKHKTVQVQRKKNDNRIGICRKGSPHSERDFRLDIAVQSVQRKTWKEMKG